MRALVLALAVESDVADDVHAGGVSGQQEHRHPLIGADVGVGHHHHDQERRGIGVGREVLPAVDHPVVAVAHRTCGELRWVGAPLRFGHRIAREQFTVEQRAQVALLLLGCAVVRDDLCVAGVWGLTAEDDGRPRRAAEDLVEQRELQLPVPLPAEFGTEMGCPQTLLAHLFLERVDDRAPGFGQWGELQVRPGQVERFDLVGDELIRPVQ
jgi:hypothetical protein